MATESPRQTASTITAAKKPTAYLEAPSIGAVLQKVLEQIAEAHTAMRAKREPDQATAQLGTVDIERILTKKHDEANNESDEKQAQGKNLTPLSAELSDRLA